MSCFKNKFIRYLLIILTLITLVFVAQVHSPINTNADLIPGSNKLRVFRNHRFNGLNITKHDPYKYIKNTRIKDNTGGYVESMKLNPNGIGPDALGISGKQEGQPDTTHGAGDVHAQLEWGDLQNTTPIGKVIRVVNPTQKFHVFYPHSAYINGVGYVDTTLTISGFNRRHHRYNPWIGKRDFVFSYKLWSGMMENGYTQYDVSYHFSKNIKGHERTVRTNPDDVMKLRAINGLSNYNGKNINLETGSHDAPEGDHNDTYANNEHYVDTGQENDHLAEGFLNASSDVTPKNGPTDYNIFAAKSKYGSNMRAIQSVLWKKPVIGGRQGYDRTATTNNLYFRADPKAYNFTFDAITNNGYQNLEPETPHFKNGFYYCRIHGDTESIYYDGERLSKAKMLNSTGLHFYNLNVSIRESHNLITHPGGKFKSMKAVNEWLDTSNCQIQEHPTQLKKDSSLHHDSSNRRWKYKGQTYNTHSNLDSQDESFDYLLSNHLPNMSNTRNLKYMLEGGKDKYRYLGTAYDYWYPSQKNFYTIHDFLPKEVSIQNSSAPADLIVSDNLNNSGTSDDKDMEHYKKQGTYDIKSNGNVYKKVGNNFVFDDTDSVSHNIGFYRHNVKQSHVDEHRDGNDSYNEVYFRLPSSLMSKFSADNYTLKVHVKADRLPKLGGKNNPNDVNEQYTFWNGGHGKNTIWGDHRYNNPNTNHSFYDYRIYSGYTYNYSRNRKVRKWSNAVPISIPRIKTVIYKYDWNNKTNTSDKLFPPSKQPFGSCENPNEGTDYTSPGFAGYLFQKYQPTKHLIAVPEVSYHYANDVYGESDTIANNQDFQERKGNSDGNINPEDAPRKQADGSYSRYRAVYPWGNGNDDTKNWNSNSLSYPIFTGNNKDKFNNEEKLLYKNRNSIYYRGLKASRDGQHDTIHNIPIKATPNTNANNNCSFNGWGPPSTYSQQPHYNQIIFIPYIVPTVCIDQCSPNVNCNTNINGNSNHNGGSNSNNNDNLPKPSPTLHQNGAEGARFIVDTDSKTHGLPFHLNTTMFNTMYDSGLPNFYNDFTNDSNGDKNTRVTLTIRASNENKPSNEGPVVYQVTRPLASIFTNRNDSLSADDKQNSMTRYAGDSYNERFTHTEYPAGSNKDDMKYWNGYIDRDALKRSVNTNTLRDNYSLDTNASDKNDVSPNGFKLSATFGITDNEGGDDINTAPITTHAYTASHPVLTENSFGKITTQHYAATKPSYSDRDINGNISPNTAIFKLPERTIKYGTDDGNVKDSNVRTIDDELQMIQPRVQMAKAGYGISANDIQVKYLGHLLAKDDSYGGTSLMTAFPQDFNYKDSDISDSYDPYARYDSLYNANEGKRFVDGSNQSKEPYYARQNYSHENGDNDVDGQLNSTGNIQKYVSGNLKDIPNDNVMTATPMFHVNAQYKALNNKVDELKNYDGKSFAIGNWHNNTTLNNVVKSLDNYSNDSCLGSVDDYFDAPQHTLNSYQIRDIDNNSNDYQNHGKNMNQFGYSTTTYGYTPKAMTQNDGSTDEQDNLKSNGGIARIASDIPSDSSELSQDLNDLGDTTYTNGGNNYMRDERNFDEPSETTSLEGQPSFEAQTTNPSFNPSYRGTNPNPLIVRDTTSNNSRYGKHLVQIPANDYKKQHWNSMRLYLQQFLHTGEYPMFFESNFNNSHINYPSIRGENSSGHRIGNGVGHRLGANFLAINEEDPLNVYAHMYITRDDGNNNTDYTTDSQGNHDYIDNKYKGGLNPQLKQQPLYDPKAFDELSPQPLLTNPGVSHRGQQINKLYQIPDSTQSFPDSIWNDNGNNNDWVWNILDIN